MNDDEAQSKPKSKLLAMLPKPKNVAPDKASKRLIPMSIARANNAPDKRPLAAVESIPSGLKVAKAEVSSSVKALVNYGSSSDEEDNKEDDDQQQTANGPKLDLLGITTSKFNIDADANAPLPAPEPIQHDAFVGPARPVPKVSFLSKSWQSVTLINSPVVKIVQDSSDDQPSTSMCKELSSKEITRIIYEKELAPYGGNMSLAREAADNIIDINVDRALGPNVRENLLKSLNCKVMAQVAVGPLPKVKKDAKDKVAKQKHQITHLAGLAVAREEMLQEQWADNKQKKRASARKYGF